MKVPRSSIKLAIIPIIILLAISCFLYQSIYIVHRIDTSRVPIVFTTDAAIPYDFEFAPGDRYLFAVYENDKDWSWFDKYNIQALVPPFTILWDVNSGIPLVQTRRGAYGWASGGYIDYRTALLTYAQDILVFKDAELCNTIPFNNNDFTILETNAKIKIAIALDETGTLRLANWNNDRLSTWKLIAKMPGTRRSGFVVAISPDGTLGLGAGANGTVLIFRIKDGREVNRFVLGTECMNAVLFNDGNAAFVTTDFKLYTCDSGSTSPIQRLAHCPEVRGLAAHPAQALLAVSYVNSNIGLSELELMHSVCSISFLSIPAYRELAIIKNAGRGTYRMRFSNDGSKLGVLANSSILVWNDFQQIINRVGISKTRAAVLSD